LRNVTYIGGSVIRMMLNFMGEENFKKGITAYLEEMYFITYKVKTRHYANITVGSTQALTKMICGEDLPKEFPRVCYLKERSSRKSWTPGLCKQVSRLSPSPGITKQTQPLSARYEFRIINKLIS